MKRALKKIMETTVAAGLLAVSPRRYRARQHFQRMDQDGDYREAYLMTMRARGYRAAKAGAAGAPWSNSSRSADGEILIDLPTMRNRSRELVRDDSLGSGIINTFAVNWVGAGMMAQANTGDPDKNNRLEAVWRDRRNTLSPADDLTHGESQRLIARKVLEDGEVLRKAVFSADEPVWFETIEADRLATPIGRTSDPRIRSGVERDDAGRPVAYWILDAPPNDVFLGGSPAGFKSTRFSAEFVRHLKFTDRPGQTRGVPMCHAILQDLRDLDLLLLASLKRTQIAACMAGFIRSDVAIEDMAEVTAQKYGYVLDQPIEPGMLFRLYPGENIETLIPNFPTPELGPFVIMIARRIGAALGVTWQVILKDFSQSTYSSARTDLLETRQTYRILQTWLIEKDLNWEWSTVMADARLRGDRRLADVLDDELGMVRWIPPGWQWVDPEKEAAAAEIELRIGTMTLRDLCAQKGTDWEEVQDQRLQEELREILKRQELGLPEKPQPEPTTKAISGNGRKPIELDADIFVERGGNHGREN
ncbi:MAG: phage portal protein [Nitrospirota bacterium]